MATLYDNLQAVMRRDESVTFHTGDFVKENITRSWWLPLVLLVLVYVLARLILSQMDAAPVLTLLIVAGWAFSVGATALSNVAHQHSPATQWLSKNLYNSLSSALVSLLLLLLIAAVLRGFIEWAFVRASFSTDPDMAKATLAQYDPPGANWGAVIDNFRNLMVFRFPREETWRIFALILWNVFLLIPSTYVYSREVFRHSRLRKVITGLWLLTPFIAYALLRGFGDGPLRQLNPDVVWGGLLLTLIIAVFGIVASFPLGVGLALGRRSDITGIPARLIYAAAAVLTAIFLWTSTVPGLQEASGLGQQILSLWPLLIPLAAYLFVRYFDGNVVAMFSTVYIEVIRGVPLITILFMSIILFPIFLPTGQMEVLSTWRVLVAVALFAAAYLAENIRGGLQSIPNGQYEAADALGLSTAAKVSADHHAPSFASGHPGHRRPVHRSCSKTPPWWPSSGSSSCWAWPTSFRRNRTGWACAASHTCLSP
jgi:general L-amino acid transport system permease protein